MEALSHGASLPLRGSIVVGRLRLLDVRRCEVPFFAFVGKFIMMRACWVSLEVARVAAHCESVLSTESCLIAMSTARGEGPARRESQSGFKIVH